MKNLFNEDDYTPEAHELVGEISRASRAKEREEENVTGSKGHDSSERVHVGQHKGDSHHDGS